jgi:hypothetical protein
LFFSEVKTSASRIGGEAAERKHWLPPLPRRFFTRRRESQHAQSRAFQLDHRAD